MARIELAPEVLVDFERFIDQLLRHGVTDAAARVADIVAAIDILAGSPLIGRPVGRGLRELVIGRGSRGYVALYRHLPAADMVFVLAIRAQSERGYRQGQP